MKFPTVPALHSYDIKICNGFTSTQVPTAAQQCSCFNLFPHTRHFVCTQLRSSPRLRCCNCCSSCSTSRCSSSTSAACSCATRVMMQMKQRECVVAHIIWREQREGGSESSRRAGKLACNTKTLSATCEEGRGGKMHAENTLPLVHSPAFLHARPRVT